jgi:hypothetical protein
MVLGSKERPTRKVGTSPLFESRLSTQHGILDVSKLHRPARPVTGIALLFSLYIHKMWTRGSAVG